MLEMVHMFDYNGGRTSWTNGMAPPSPAQGGREMERNWIKAAIIDLLDRADEAQLRAIFQFIFHYLNQ